MLLIAETVVLAMCRNPHDRWTFSGQCAKQCEHPPQRAVCLEAGVRQQAVKAQADAETPCHPTQEHGQKQSAPCEAERRS